MKTLALIASLLLPSALAFGQTYTNANLTGNYSFQSMTPVLYSWSKTFTCPTNATVKYTVVGSQTTSQVTYGTATFDGIGSLTITETMIGNFNPSGSANTTSVSWSSTCQVTKVNSGYIVYAANVTKSTSATYSVQSNGSGTIVDTSGNTLTFLLAGTNSSGLSTTILLAGSIKNGNPISATTAIHQ